MREEAKIAYAAGFFDGEGSVFMKSKRQLTISVTQLFPEPLQLFSDLFGGNIISGGYTNSGVKVFQWNRVNAAAIEAMRIMRPFLTVKAAQVDVALEFPLGVSGTKLTDEILAERDRIRVELKDLKNETYSGDL